MDHYILVAIQSMKIEGYVIWIPSLMERESVCACLCGLSSAHFDCKVFARARHECVCSVYCANHNMHTLTALPLLVYMPCFYQVQETWYRLFVIELIVIHNSLAVTERDLYYS